MTTPLTPEALEHSCPLCRPSIWRREILEHILAHARSIEAGRRARASAKALTPEQRSARARHASSVRWARRRDYCPHGAAWSKCLHTHPPRKE